MCVTFVSDEVGELQELTDRWNGPAHDLRWAVPSCWHPGVEHVTRIIWLLRCPMTEELSAPEHWWRPTSVPFRGLACVQHLQGGPFRESVASFIWLRLGTFGCRFHSSEQGQLLPRVPRNARRMRPCKRLWQGFTLRCWFHGWGRSSVG